MCKQEWELYVVHFFILSWKGIRDDLDFLLEEEISNINLCAHLWLCQDKGEKRTRNLYWQKQCESQFYVRWLYVLCCWILLNNIQMVVLYSYLEAAWKLLWSNEKRRHFCVFKYENKLQVLFVVWHGNIPCKEQLMLKFLRLCVCVILLSSLSHPVINLFIFFIFIVFGTL